MEQYAIKGGNPLVGEVEIGGAKNAALPILAASVMTDETVYIENMPDVRDTNVLLCAMENIGVIVKRTDRHKVTLNASNISELVVEDENIKKIRASYYLIGALLGKYKHAEVALPGGCDIGCRAIDQHIKGFRALGAEVRIEHGLIKTHAEHLRGSHIYMDVVSVGATINIMMAAVMAEMMGMPEEMMADMAPPMYVATNQDKVHGAAVMFYTDFMDQAAKELGGDIFILPSSVHEVLILPDDGNMDAQELKEMVTSINASEVSPEDRLTDSVYHYDAQERIFELGEKFEERQAEKMAAKEERSSVLKDLQDKKQDMDLKPKTPTPHKSKNEQSIG